MGSVLWSGQSHWLLTAVLLSSQTACTSFAVRLGRMGAPIRPLFTSPPLYQLPLLKTDVGVSLMSNRYMIHAEF